MQTQKTVSSRLFTIYDSLKRFVISKVVAVQCNDGTYFPVKVHHSWRLVLQPQRSFRLFNIIERNLYREFHKNYPIQDLSDIKSVLLQEFGSLAQHQISPLRQNTRQVSSFLFDESLLSSIRIPCFTVPASLLLAKAVSEKNATMGVLDHQPWFLAKFAGNVQSQTQSTLISDIQRFRYTQGLPEDLPHRDVSVEQSWDLVLHGAQQIKPAELHSFWRHPDFSVFKTNWQPYAMVMVISTAIYMLASSLLINMQTDRRSLQISAMGEELNLLLEKQAVVIAAADSIRALAAFQQEQVFAAPTWELVNFLVERQTTLLDVRQTLYTIELRGRAARSTDILLMLREHTLVDSAEFTSPTVKVEQLEEFTIRIVLKKRATNAIE